MKKTFVLALLAAALSFALAVSCTSEDLCGQSPLCDANVATNCDPSCTVGPCSNSPTIRDCGEQASCQIASGDINSTRFFRARAVCVVSGSSGCDPDASTPPTCDGLGNIQGCSAYKQVIVAPCAQAGLFFDSSECCLHPPDGGLPDAGAPDAGDAGP
jgi:hypothetical protein